jgi:ribosomal protein L11 methyltransferase
MPYTKYTFRCEPVQPTAEILTAFLSDLGFESFIYIDNGMEGYVLADTVNDNEISEILEQISGRVTYSKTEIPDENWNATWEASYDPVIVEEKCIVRAPFHNPSGQYQMDIVIHPEMSFGTGHHETTWLMLKAMFELDIQGKAVLDMGCGTGILGITARKLEALSVLAVDIEDRAVHSTIENARLNNVQLDVQKGDSTLIYAQSFDLILANINKNVLLHDMNLYAGALNDGGTILLSGFFKSDVQDLKDAAAKEGLVFYELNTKNDWATLHFNKANPSQDTSRRFISGIS